MKVLFVINSLGAGGAEHSLSEMISPLGEAGVSSLIACLAHRDVGFEADAVSRGADVRFIGPSLLAATLDLRRLIHRERPRVVHTTIFEADLVGRLASVGSRPPVLTSLVNTSYAAARQGDPNVKARRLEAVRAVDGWTARHMTAHFHAITEAVKTAAVSDLGIHPERITVVERGRDPIRLGEPGARRKREARGRLGLSDDDEVVLTVGRQEYQKGQRFLLEAVELLSSRRPKLRLLLAGRSGHASPQLAELARRPGLGNRMVLLGHRSDIPDLLAAADVFAFPSLYEGLGGAVIEAMALGLPIVASDVPALREVVEEGGNAMLVPAADPAALAEAIDAVLEDDTRALAFGRRSREIFEDRFTLQRSVDRMVALYGRIAPA